MRLFLTTTTMATALAWGGLLVVLFEVDPTQTTTAGFALFYLSLAVALYGTFFLGSFWLRQRAARRRTSRRGLDLGQRVAASVRHSAFFSVLVVGSLAMQARDVLTWWTLLLFVFILTLLEFFFLGKRDGARQ